MKRKISIVLIMILTLGFFALPTMAQQDMVTATVDRTNITTDDTVLLSVVVANANARPELPVLTGLNVVDSSQSTQISIVNGSMSSQGVYQYRLQPTETGDLTIAPVSVTVNGQQFTTQPIQLQVSQGQGPAQSIPNVAQPDSPATAPTTLSGQDLYIEGTVDNVAPFQGEQITYSFRFYQAINVSGQPSYQPPGFSGLWNDVEPTQGSYTTDVAGRTYRVTEINTILFPTVAGEVIIEPTTLVIPGGLWSQDTTLQTQSVILDVQPLPAGAPLSFKGAVGKYGLGTQVDKQETKVGEPITLNVEISGEGNIGSLGDPSWPDDVNWRAFENDSSTYTEVVNGRLRGTKSYERLMVPTNSGDIQLPGVEYTYFDPETQSYETLTSDPVPVAVSGTAVTYSPDLLDATAAGASNSGLRAIKAMTAVDSGRGFLTDNPLYWLLWLLPLGLVAGQLARQKQKAYRAATADERRRSNAARKAHKALDSARSRENSYAAIGRILTAYLEDKSGEPVRGMTTDGRSTLLRQSGVSERTIAATEICLAQAEAGRYAPGTGSQDVDELLQHTRQTIDKLEGYLS